jgi:hypothetical protein
MFRPSSARHLHGLEPMRPNTPAQQGVRAIGSSLVCPHPELRLAAERLVISALTVESGHVARAAYALSVPERTLRRWLATNVAIRQARLELRNGCMGHDWSVMADVAAGQAE